MSEETQIWEQIDRYFSGEMNPTERDVFEQAIASDKQLAEQIEASKIASEVVVGFEVLKLKAQMTRDLAKPNNNFGKYGLGLLALITVSGVAYFGLNVPTSKTMSNQSEITSPMPQAVDARPADVATSEEPTTSHVSSQQTKDLKVVVKKEDANQKVAEKLGIDALNSKEVVVLPKSNEEPIKHKVSTEDKKEVSSQAVKKIDVCEGITIEMDLYTSASCKGGHTGAIHVKMQTLKGGQAPYTFSTDAEHYTDASALVDLEAGSYRLFVKDANACSLQYPNTVVVNEIACAEPAKEFTYNPAYDPAWVIPYNTHKNAKSVKIFDKSGREVFTATVHNGAPNDWNGDSNTGLNVGMGNHPYIIEYTDGTIDKGTIMIVR